jgi:hypothetical protein
MRPLGLSNIKFPQAAMSVTSKVCPERFPHFGGILAPQPFHGFFEGTINEGGRSIRGGEQRIENALSSLCDICALNAFRTGKHSGNDRVMFIGRLVTACEPPENNRCEGAGS